jgi:hypothetical protein
MLKPYLSFKGLPKDFFCYLISIQICILNDVPKARLEYEAPVRRSSFLLKISTSTYREVKGMKTSTTMIDPDP